MTSHDDPCIQNLNEIVIIRGNQSFIYLTYLHPSKLVVLTLIASGSSYVVVVNLQDNLEQMVDSVLASCENPDVFYGVA